MTQTCPPINCDHPVKLPGQCCPSCEIGITDTGMGTRGSYHFLQGASTRGLCTETEKGLIRRIIARTASALGARSRA